MYIAMTMPPTTVPQEHHHERLEQAGHGRDGDVDLFLIESAILFSMLSRAPVCSPTPII